MSIPNTTPTPNELYNGEMKKMKDTELRVVLVVTRATLGWVIDKKTGMRKTEDWIAHSQLIKKSGRGSKAISMAVDNCVKNGWIETRTGEGKLLRTAQERKMHGRKIYYRLGKVFLNKVNTIVKKKMVDKPSSICPPDHRQFVHEPSSKGRTTKETITKEIITKQATQSVADINKLIEKFEPINPSFKQLFKNKTQRAAMARIVHELGEEKTDRLLGVLPQVMGLKYAPTITTPYQLEKKMGELMIFLKKESDKKSNFVVI